MGHGCMRQPRTTTTTTIASVKFINNEAMNGVQYRVENNRKYNYRSPLIMGLAWLAGPRPSARATTHTHTHTLFCRPVT